MSYLRLFIISGLLIIQGQMALAGAWTLKKNELWVKSSLFVQRTSYRYASTRIICADKNCSNGQRTTYFFNGELIFNAVYLDAWFGLTDKIELQFQLPYFDISFNDDSNPNRAKTKSIGDLVFGARYNLLLKPFVYTLKIAAKAPTGFFNKDAEVIPVGDGQWDLLIQSQLGKSLSRLRTYVNLDLGYTIRFRPNIDKTNIHPGDEFSIRAEIGYEALENLWIKTGVNGFRGQEFRALFSESQLTLKDSERTILFWELGLYWELYKKLAVEAVMKYSIAGKNYPAGQVFGLGVSYKFNAVNNQKVSS